MSWAPWRRRKAGRRMTAWLPAQPRRPWSPPVASSQPPPRCPGPGCGRGPPAYLEIPLDLRPEPTPLRPERFARGSGAPPPSPASLAAAHALLAEAERPLFIAGGGARGAGAALRRLVEATDGYLVTTVAGKGVVAESHPANLGASLPFAAIQELVAAADVVIAAGTELSQTELYTTTRLAMSGRLVRLDVDDFKLADQFAPEVVVRGDAAASLEALAGDCRTRKGWRTASGAAAAYRARVEAQFDAPSRARLAAVQALRESVPADGVVFTDMTQLAYLGNYAFPAERPGLWFHPSGYGALGFALPAALGETTVPDARREMRRCRGRRAG